MLKGSTPEVSVLLPVRDGEATLDEALRSIRRQTLASWELVAVDDGSGDGSLEILERHAREDPRVRIDAGPRRGIVPALERARALARAPLLARMDADDRALPPRLALQAHLMESRPGTVLCGTHVRYFPPGRVRGGARRYEEWLNSLRSPDDLSRALWIECPLAHPTFMLRAEAVEAVGGYRDAGWPEDYDLLLRLWCAGGTLDVVARVLLEWREGPGRLSRTDARYAPEAFRRAKLEFLSRTLLRGRSGLVIWGAGPVGKGMAVEARARGIPVRAFVDLSPRRVGQTIHGAPVIPPGEANRFRDALSLAAVGQPGARDEIRRTLVGAGWVEGRDFVAVA